MAKKNVTVFRVELAGIDEFSQILLNPDFYSAIELDSLKTTELKFVEKNPNGTITGLFVTTQKKGIPPAHTPGGDDYTAIPLDDGQGLAYPNTILYDPHTGALYIETNRIGVNEGRICEYFTSHALKNGLTEFNISLLPILKSEAYKRVDRMILIDSVECKIANPIQIIKDSAQNGSIRQFGALARELNATKTMSFIFKSEEVTGGLSKSEILNMIKFFSRVISGTSTEYRNNKLKIIGRNHLGNEDMSTAEEVVDLLLDKIKGSFKLDEPNVASHLLYTERKRGITEVYSKFSREVLSIVGNKI